jgi:hypothetical protein
MTNTLVLKKTTIVLLGAVRRVPLHITWLWLMVLLNPALAWAQAGSRAPVFFQAQESAFKAASGAASRPPPGGEIRPLVPVGVWQLAPSTRFLLWVELVQGRLNVLENLGEAGLVLRKRIPISIGKQGIGKKVEGDNKTPIGIYQLQPLLADAELSDFYGTGAYPLNYPNALDRLQGRSGHGIWLHGLPKGEVQRSFLASEGCVVIDNDSLLSLRDDITASNSLIVLSQSKLQWMLLSDARSQAEGLVQALSKWHVDNVVDRSSENALSELSFLVEPLMPKVVHVLFQQPVEGSSAFPIAPVSNDAKEQLWQQDGSAWKLLYDGSRDGS